MDLFSQLDTLQQVVSAIAPDDGTSVTWGVVIGFIAKQLWILWREHSANRRAKRTTRRRDL
jgi:hypothetical protein